MFQSSVLCCLVLFIVQATATTCTQQGTQDCDLNLRNFACKGLGEAGNHNRPLSCPSSSCLDLHLGNPSAPSGIYQIELSNGTVVNVYCDMEGTNCNGEGGWTRVAFVNMSQPGATCPTGLTQIEQSGLTLCTRNDTNLIQSAVFATLGLNYSAVCGRIRGYQYSQPEAFHDSISNIVLNISFSVDDTYVNGVSITHGINPRQHVWTYAVGYEEGSHGSLECPCNQGSIQPTPSFVGENYYCESAVDESDFGVLYTDDILWDGMNCRSIESTCCPSDSKQPWFNTTLPETANDDLELRLMFDQPRSNQRQGSPIDLIELFIR